jgi:pyridoxal 5'-phosphate synthase pdxS subunit
MPVVNFAAGGIATGGCRADDAVGRGRRVCGIRHFQVGRPRKTASRDRESHHHYQDAKLLAEVSRNLGEPMVGRQISSIPEQDLIAKRGW